MITSPLRTALAILIASASAWAGPTGPTDHQLERISTVAPFPRGLAMVEGRLHVLCRGRVRELGGVTAEIDDQAGTIYAMDPNLTEPADGPVGAAVESNGSVVVRPTAPPFRPWDRTADPPESDRLTDRPYCTLRFDRATDSFYICGFSGIDKAVTDRDHVAFSKNLSDVLLRFDRRNGAWHEVERHDIEAGGSYPHHDPRYFPPPHGWLNGPDNCLPVGDGLYAVSKDNSLLVRYDLRGVRESPDAGAPDSEVVLGETVSLETHGMRRLYGQSALAYHDGWLYVGYRTSSVIVRVRLDEAMRPKLPIRAQLVAQFEPYDARSGRSANITDMSFDEHARLYVISAVPARVHRFAPDPARVYDGRHAEPWADLAALTANPRMKCENVLWHDGWLYVTSGDGYHPDGAVGTVYRLRAR